MRLLCDCYAIAMRLLCDCYAITMRLPCDCHVITMRLPLLKASVTRYLLPQMGWGLNSETTPAHPKHLKPNLIFTPAPPQAQSQAVPSQSNLRHHNPILAPFPQAASTPFPGRSITSSMTSLFVSPTESISSSPRCSSCTGPQTQKT